VALERRLGLTLAPHSESADVQIRRLERANAQLLRELDRTRTLAAPTSYVGDGRDDLAQRLIEVTKENNTLRHALSHADGLSDL
jgi:hypothetical protein